jgi:transposase-like protein
MVKISLAMRKAAKPKILFNPDRNPRECVYCHSTHTGIGSVRRNVSGDVRRYTCYDCNKKYSFREIKYNYYTIIEAVKLYLDDVRLCDIEQILNECAKRATIRKWIHRFEERMKKYIDTIDAPVIKAKNKTKKIVEINDVYERAKSDMKYLFSLMDDGTKIWLAQECIIMHDAVSKINQLDKEISMGDKQ